MSMSYWGIVGYGVCVDDIYKYIDIEKVNDIVRKLMPEEEFEEDVFEDDTFCGNPYSNFAEFLCELDDDKIFTWDDNGNGTSYFLFTPRYPWYTLKNDPLTQKECADKMVSVLQKVCPETSSEDLRDKIDYVSDWGCG